MNTDLDVRRIHQQLERQHRQMAKELETGALRWMVPRFLSTSTIGVGVTLVIPGLVGGGLAGLDVGSPAFWVKLLGPFVVAAAVTPWLYFRTRTRSHRSPDDIIRESDAEFESLTGPGWVGRVVRQGARFAAILGATAGALLAFGLPPDELPAGSRLLALAGFTLASALWTIPASFGMRWLSLRERRIQPGQDGAW